MPSRLTVVLVSLLLVTPAVAFWLWLVIVPARVAILCPKECQCDIGGYNVRCGYASVNPIPLIHLTNVQGLLVILSKITVLEKYSFVSMTELLILKLEQCGLRTIELEAFNGLTKLTRLSMSENEISSILPGTFKNMSSLEYLHLGSNRIKHLNSAAFSGLGTFKGLTKLTFLSVANNHIRDILPGTFENMGGLDFLDLGSNGIEHLNSAAFSGLRAFNELTNLTILSINLNGISDILPGTFENMSSLEILDLSYNKLQSVNSEIFRVLFNLKILQLSGNELKTLHPHILRAFPELSELYLYDNPLQCDCQLQEVWRWCADRNIRTAHWEYVTKCDTPIEVKGVRWEVLEKGQCLEGNMQYNGVYKKETYSGFRGVVGAFKYKSKVWKEFNYDYDVSILNQIGVYAVPFIFGTTGNFILLIIIISNKDMRTVPNKYILSLAISDIIYLTVFFSEVCANTLNTWWENDGFKCIFLSFIRRMSVGLSAYSVALYSFQRYRVTVRPFLVLVSSQTKWRGIVPTFCGVWLVAALFAVPSALSKYLCEESSYPRFITYYQRVVVFELLVSCVLPLCVIAFSYIMTARHLEESSRAISEGTQNLKLKVRSNAGKIVVGLTVVFVISYVPYHIFWVYFICSQEHTYLVSTIRILYASNQKVKYTYLISTCSLLINSCLNPVALFCTSSQFRQHLKRYLTCFCKKRSPSTDFELARRN